MFSWDDVVESAQFLRQHFTVQEEESVQRLVLCRSAHVSVNGKGREKLLDFSLAHCCGMPLLMKEDKAFDPVHVGLLGLVAVVPQAEDVADLVKQFWLPYH
jgi:hypothetical protein